MTKSKWGEPILHPLTREQNKKNNERDNAEDAVGSEQELLLKELKH